jgi:hypothetical protein
MDLDSVYKDLRMEQVDEFLNVKTQAGIQCLHKRCSNWSSNSATLKSRTAQVGKLRHQLSPAIRAMFEEEFAAIRPVEMTVQKVLAPESEFSEECYGQLLFRGEWLQPLNHVPWLLAVLRFYKIFLAPASTIAMPLLAIILPYFLIRYVFNMPMPVKAYIGILRKVYSGSLGLDAAPAEAGPLASLKVYGQTAWLIFNFVQSLWQPIQSARHLYKLDTTLTEQGESVRQLVTRTWNLRNLFAELDFKSPPLGISVDDVSDVRRAVATALENKPAMESLLKQLGDYEVFYALASHADLALVTWRSGARPLVDIKDTFDIRVQGGGVPISCHFGQHAMLTGPNRGGKSTALRAIGRSIFMAHCFGVAIGREATMTPLQYLQTCLRLEDVPGERSLFEREVAMAATALRRVRAGQRGLLLIDELFHSTNPPDAEIASRRFLDELWTSKNTLSVISTHLFGLVETSHNIQRLCCPASVEGGKVKYKYGLEAGVCRISSVGEILDEQGLRDKRGS